ncbi:MAG TPA: hypothetical protein VFZ61_30425, partial [Polyangiales bacterium]
MPEDAGEGEPDARDEQGPDSAGPSPSAGPDARACAAGDCDEEAPLDAGPAASSDAEAAADVEAGAMAVIAADAGDATDAGDAGLSSARDASGLDAARATWVGRYATRSYVFWYDPPVRAIGSYLTLAEITPSADGGLMLTEELCRFESSFSWGITAQVEVNFPAGVRLSAPLTYDDEHFSAAPARAYVGYAAAPADCAPGKTSPVEDGRAWFGGTCDCSNSSAPPTSARDCRVTDPDGDGEPGTTFQGALDSTAAVFRVTQEQHLRLVNGYRSGDRVFAQREFADVTRVL